MTKREKMHHDAEDLARKALGPNADHETLREVAQRIYQALPKRVREAA